MATVITNNSNTELAPAMASSAILAMFPFLASRRGIPAFAVKGLELTISQIEDTNITNTHIYIGGLPRIYPLGYGKAWMEGGIFEMGFINRFKHEF